MAQVCELALAGRDVLITKLQSAERNLVLNSSTPGSLLQISHRALDVFGQIADDSTEQQLAPAIQGYTDIVRGGKILTEVPGVEWLPWQIRPDRYIEIYPDRLVEIQPLGEAVAMAVGQVNGGPLVVEIQQITFTEVNLPGRELHPEGLSRKLTDPLVLIPEWADEKLLEFLAGHRKIFASQMLSGKIDLGVIYESVKSQRQGWRDFIRRSLGLDLASQLSVLNRLVWLTTFSELLAAAMEKGRSG